MATPPTGRRLATFGEIVVAPLSFLLYRTVRFAMRRLVQLQAFLPAGRTSRWQVLDGQTVRRPFNLLALMTSAPRWNTHAIISLTGSVRVRQTVRIHAATAETSAASWTVVVHEEPSHRIVASVGSIDGPSADGWRSLDVPSGKYRLALRYYGWSEPVVLPTVEVDGAVAVESMTIPADSNDFYHGLSSRGGLFYTWLHSYVCTLLRYRDRFPRSFVEGEYLPAGNPQTTFHYGFLPAAARLDIELCDHLLGSHDAYLTVYNRASFPLLWYSLVDNHHLTPPTTTDGSYLIRLHARTPAPPTCDCQRVRLRVRPADQPAESAPVEPATVTPVPVETAKPQG